MKIYYVGNPDVAFDSSAHTIVDRLNKTQEFVFEEIKLNQDLPFENQEDVTILDVVLGLNEVKVLELKNFDALLTSKSVSAHDFDLSFQLKYLKKLGKLGNVKIIGLPEVLVEKDYKKVQSILRKLVAQDMQGS